MKKKNSLNGSWVRVEVLHSCHVVVGASEYRVWYGSFER
jgi:hypothetical protein